MSVSLIKGRGWRYDFVLKGKRYTSTYYKTKSEAREAERERREEIKNPKPEIQTPTDMDFLDLVNRRLDHANAYNSRDHYETFFYYGRYWIKEWPGLKCSEITSDMIQSFVLKRAKVSAYTANKEIRYLRGLFNFGIKKGWIQKNPAKAVAYLPVNKKPKYVPPKEDVLRVLLAADPDTQDYLWTIIQTMGRMSEINQMTWDDVNFEERFVILYTCKKRGGNRTPRKIPMTSKLYEVLSRRYKYRNKSKQWVFWHRYWSRKKQEWVEGPYTDRKRIMKTLCKRSGVKYFRYHTIRHFGASTLERANVTVGSIQRILGHERRTTTEIYLHSIDGAEREAMDIFEKEFEKVTPKFTPKRKKGVNLNRLTP